MTTLTKEEYLAKTGRGLAPGFGPTSDFTDPQLGATAQSEGGIPDQLEGLPGQVYAVEQLPNPDVALAYGLPPVGIPEHLILDADSDAALKAQGPDILDAMSLDLREELGDPALTHTGEFVQGGASAAVDALNLQTGAVDESASASTDAGDSSTTVTESAHARKAREAKEKAAAEGGTPS